MRPRGRASDAPLAARSGAVATGQIVVDIDNRTCPAARAEFARIGETRQRSGWGHRSGAVSGAVTAARNTPAGFANMVVVQPSSPSRLDEAACRRSHPRPGPVVRNMRPLPLVPPAPIYARQGIELVDPRWPTGSDARCLAPSSAAGRLLVRLKPAPHCWRTRHAPVARSWPGGPRPGQPLGHAADDGHGAAVIHLAREVYAPIASSGQ